MHNAGITRDKTLANMNAERWEQAIDVNLASILRINDALLGKDGLRDGGRIVCVSSIAGIAGNLGQTNYAATKAGVIGWSRSRGQAPAARAASPSTRSRRASSRPR